MKSEQHYSMSLKIRNLLYRSMLGIFVVTSLITIGIERGLQYTKGAFELPLVLFYIIGISLWSITMYALIHFYILWLKKKIFRPYLEDADRNMLSEMELIAYYDELTQLPNKFMLFSHYEEEKKGNKTKSKKHPSFFMYMDVDNLKRVNDLHGHIVGDRIIIGIAKYMESILISFPGYELFRLDGDEFGICTSDSVDEESVFRLAKILNDSFSEPFYTDEHVLYASLSIGIRFNDNDRLSLDEIMNQAEIAMYEVKQTGKSNFTLYREEMSESLMRRRELEEELKGAVEKNELYLVYQPKMLIETGECYGFEALLRWKSEKRGFISPEIFIEIAEETGLIHSIGQFVIEEACKFSKELNRDRDKKYKISVNVSAIQLLREDFMERFLETIVKYRIQPQELEVEVTESVLMNFMESAVKKLRQLFVLGIDIAIDDFGKGYSSLAYLKTLPVTVVKIDKLFVDDILENEDLIIEDIIDIGHRMGLKVIAEGVELKEQLDYLKEKNCDSIQGYYYSRPLIKEHLIEFLERQDVERDE